MADDQATDVRNARVARGSEISDWMLANVAKQKFDFESAVLAKQFPAGQFGTLPWGNTTIIQQAPEAAKPPAASGGLLGKLLPLAAAAALGATGGGLAVPAIAALFGGGQQQAAQQPGTIDIPVQIDWNFDPHGGTVKPKQ